MPTSKKTKRVVPKKTEDTKKSQKELKKPPFDVFLSVLQKDINKNGRISSEKHHPDMHYLGASPQCPLCDLTLPSAKSLYNEVV